MGAAPIVHCGVPVKVCCANVGAAVALEHTHRLIVRVHRRAIIGCTWIRATYESAASVVCDGIGLEVEGTVLRATTLGVHA